MNRQWQLATLAEIERYAVELQKRGPIPECMEDELEWAKDNLLHILDGTGEGEQ